MSAQPAQGQESAAPAPTFIIQAPQPAATKPKSKWWILGLILGLAALALAAWILYEIIAANKGKGTNTGLYCTQGSANDPLAWTCGAVSPGYEHGGEPCTPQKSGANCFGDCGKTCKTSYRLLIPEGQSRPVCTAGPPCGLVADDITSGSATNCTTEAGCRGIVA